MIDHQSCALIIAGHGSTVNAESSLPTFQHAEILRARSLFAEVHVAFWKEEPNFRQGLLPVESKEIYIVPDFISSGYFTEQVIPREFGLTGPITARGETKIFYCEPVGLHESMTGVLLQKAEEVVHFSDQSTKLQPSTCCLMLCGHGTSLNDNSTKIIYEQVEKIKKLNLYAECQAVFMEQKPLIKEWKNLTKQPQVIVVPFFISDGLHSFEDIPNLLGLNIDEFKNKKNPQLVDDRLLWYSSAIGTHPSIAKVILAQVNKFDETYRNLSEVA